MSKKRSSDKPLYNPDDEKPPKKWEYTKKPKLTSPGPSDKEKENFAFLPSQESDKDKFDLSSADQELDLLLENLVNNPSFEGIYSIVVLSDDSISIFIDKGHVSEDFPSEDIANDAFLGT